MKRLPAMSLLVGLGTWLTLLPTHADPQAVPIDEARCFQVQFLLRLNGLEAQHFVQQVASLRAMDPEDPATTARVGDLSRQAVTLRAEEAQAFTRLSQLFKTMGAPPGLRDWSEETEDNLLLPVTMDGDERKMATAQPDVANILATLDECDRVKADTDEHTAPLGTWLGLAYHGPGPWAADVGEVTATIHAGLAYGTPPRLASTLGRRLAIAAPIGTPAPVVGALGTLSPDAGNLGDLAPPTTVDVPPTAAAHARDALVSAFSAQALAAQFPTPSP